jgi:hypothetical protein
VGRSAMKLGGDHKYYAGDEDESVNDDHDAFVLFCQYCFELRFECLY